MSELDSRTSRVPETAFEPTDVDLRPIGWIAAGVFVWLGLVPYILSLGYPDAAHDAFKAPTVVPPGPRLQQNPQADLAAFRAAKEERLDSYGWVDRAHQIVHIPIDDAMKQIAAHGLPDWPAKPAPGGSQGAPP
jgi:hypothetical protein